MNSIRSDEIVELLKRIDRGIIPVTINITGPQDTIVNEAAAMDLIWLSGYRYLLTKKGILLLRSGKSYDDFLRDDFLPPQNPNATQIAPHKTKSQGGTHPGSTWWKKLLNVSIKILNNDWIKLIITAVIAGLIIWYFTIKK